MGLRPQRRLLLPLLLPLQRLRLLLRLQRRLRLVVWTRLLCQSLVFRLVLVLMGLVSALLLGRGC